MIIARFIYTGGRCRGFRVAGHSGYSESGSDIVCAAVTSAVSTVANGVTEILKFPAQVRQSDAEISLILQPDSASSGAVESAEAMLRALELQLTGIASEYKRFLKVEKPEIQTKPSERNDK